MRGHRHDGAAHAEAAQLPRRLVAVVRGVLTKLGYTQIDKAHDGVEAVEMARQTPYDLILMDCQMPRMDGYEATRQLRGLGVRSTIVAMTAHALSGDREKCLDAGMDDVLSKPLSVPALTAMIKKFWDAPDEEAQEAPAADLHKADAVLDTDMLEQYIELVGPKLINDGLAVFEKMMPGYVSVLESNLTAQDKKGIVEEGHKIKGAAGSVGLRHLQQLGQQIQSPDLPAWEDNVGEWIEEMKEEWRHDVEVLKAWVAKATKK
jgi:two-component system aerobic respiration control sensor histidine kinase ArcB